MDPKKAAAEWFRDTVFREEPIRSSPREPVKQDVRVSQAPRVSQTPRVSRAPAALLAARVMANVGFESWQSRERIFLKQAKLLENYQDDYSFDCPDLPIYCPTYQSLNDQQLRAYFSWRTRVRRGESPQAGRCFVFLYSYELLNQIGVTDPMDGHRKLLDLRAAYGENDSAIRSYLERWQLSYVVYYGLDAALLSGSAQVRGDTSVSVLEDIQNRQDEEVARALRECSTGWLNRSRFYATHREEMDRVMVRVLRRVSAHCANLKKTMMDRYFGSVSQSYVELFAGAVFCDPLKRKDYTYTLDSHCVYTCKDRYWTVCRRTPTPSIRGKFDNLLKTIDAAMRGAFDYGHPIRTKPESKWVLRAIQEEIEALLAEQQAAEAKKIDIDFSKLTKIRADAAETREKLIVEEETDLPLEPVGEHPPAPVAADPAPVAPAAPVAPVAPDAGDLGLDPAERRLLECLLYGGNLGWVQEAGYLLSVLADGINEKLYDTFADSVLDDSPQVVEDYIDDLKEMIRP